MKWIEVSRAMDIPYSKGSYIDNNSALSQFVPIALIQTLKFLKILSISYPVIRRNSWSIYKSSHTYKPLMHDATPDHLRYNSSATTTCKHCQTRTAEIFQAVNSVCSVGRRELALISNCITFNWFVLPFHF